MRIHLQNPIDDPLFHFSRAMWDAAAGPNTRHDVTIGDTQAELAAATSRWAETVTGLRDTYTLAAIGAAAGGLTPQRIHQVVRAAS